MYNDDLQTNSQDDDYYAFLNVPKNASAEDIRNAYKVLSRRFHPDKHTDPALKHQAELMFDKLKKIYDVLSDPNKRAIYDTVGPSGIENDGWALVEKKFKTAQEIKEEYEQLQKEKEERRLQQRTNPKGSITVLVDATELFEPEDERSLENILSAVEVRSMTISQSIEAPLTLNDNLILNGHINVRNGIGSGTVSASVRHIVSPTTWFESELGVGQGPVIALKGFRTLTSDIHLNCQTVFHVTPFGIRPGLNFVLTRQFSKNFIGFMSYKTGADSSMSTAAVYENDFCRINGSIQFGYRNSFISSSYTHKFKENETRLKVGLKYGLIGAFLEYGGETKISKHSTLGASMSVGTSTGVMLRIKLNRNNQSYIFPIMLSDEILPGSIFYGTVVPCLSYFLVKSLIVDPYLKKREKENLDNLKETNKSKLEENRRQATAYMELMKETYSRILEREQQSNGLVIEKAIYGSEQNVTEYEHSTRPIPDTADAFDVTITLQVMVSEDSKITFAPTSKSYLPGFYDPYHGGIKKLLIRYKFANKQYRVLLDEKESALLPSEEHRV